MPRPNIDGLVWADRVEVLYREVRCTLPWQVMIYQQGDDSLSRKQTGNVCATEAQAHEIARKVLTQGYITHRQVRGDWH